VEHDDDHADPQSIKELWRSVLLRGILDAAGYLNAREPERTTLVWSARTWLGSADFEEVVELSGVSKKWAVEARLAVLEHPPVERNEQPRKGGRGALDHLINATRSGLV
jgi:hypothetical protein